METGTVLNLSTGTSTAAGVVRIGAGNDAIKADIELISNTLAADVSSVQIRAQDETNANADKIGIQMQSSAAIELTAESDTGATNVNIQARTGKVSGDTNKAGIALNAETGKIGMTGSVLRGESTSVVCRIVCHF